MQQNNFTEFHTLRLFVGIKNIHLLVRFPCRLSFQLKSDSSTAETLSTYELKKGQCEVNETIQCQFDIAFDNQRRLYEDKKIRLVVMMSSANGVIPAGMVMINPCQNEPLQRIQQTLTLEKCPDRSATIRFTRWYEFVRASTTTPAIYHSTYLDTRYTLKNNNKQQQQELKHSTYTNQNYGRQSKYSPAKRDTTPNRLQVGSSNTIGTVGGQSSVSRVRTYTSPVYENNVQQQQMSYNIQGVQGQDLGMAQSYIEQPSYGHTASFYPMNQSAYVGSPNQNNYGQFHSGQFSNNHHQGHQQQQKLQFGQKANYLKQIARLKGEIKSLQQQDKWQQLLKVKQQNQGLMMQLQKGKQKYRNVQKKEREYNMTIKQLRDQLQRMRVKLTNSESVRGEMEENLVEKEKKLKEWIQEGKRLEEKVGDLQMQLAANQKRIQFRQTSLQQQITKLTSKQSQSQSQRQKITFQYNSLLSRMQQTQKKYQLNQKEKQRYYNEQKNKLGKRIEGLTQQLQRVKEEVVEKDGQLGEVTAGYKALAKRQQQKQQRLVKLQNQLQFLNVSYKKQQQQRKTLQSQLSILKSIQQQRNTLKKKYNDTFTQLTTTKQKLHHTTNDLLTITNKSKQLQTLLQQLKKEKSSLNSKINLLNKQLEHLNKVHDKKTKQQQLLSAQHMNTNQRVNDLKTKLQTQQRDFTQMAHHYQEQINYLTKAKQYTDAQLEDFKWTLAKQKQHYHELSEKLKQSTQQTLLLNKELLQSGDKIKRIQQELAQALSYSKTLFNDKLSLQEKQRTLQQALKTKTQQNYQISKLKLQLQQDLYLIKEKLQQSQAYLKDKSFNDQKLIKQKQKEIQTLNQESTKAQLEILHLKEDINALNQSISIKTNQITHLKDNNTLLQDKINDLELKNQNIREELKNCNFQLTNTKNQKDSLKLELQTTNKTLQKLKSDWQQYRTNTTNALEQLVSEVSKDEDTSSSKQQSLLIFPDMNISSMQVEAIKKRNAIIGSYRQKISSLQKDLALNKQNLDKLKQKIQEKQAEHEFILLKEKQKTKQFITEAAKERELITEELRKSEQKNIQLLSEVQRLNNEIKKVYEIIEEAKSQNKELIAQREHLKLQIKTLQERILELKSLQIKSKATHESKFTQLNDHSEQEILKIKQHIIETERKVLLNEKIISEKQQSIKKLENELATITNERNRIEQKSIQLNQKVSTLSDDKKLLEKKIKLLEKQVKEQTQLFQQSQQSVNNEKTKLQQVKTKYNQTFEQLTDSQVQNQKLKQQLELSLLTITSLQSNLKQKEEKHKGIEQKLSTQVKQLKEKLITLNSDLELKAFITKQLQDQLQSSKDSITELKDEIHKKKDQIIKLGQELESKKNNLLQVDQSLNINKSQKENLREQNERLRIRVNSIENQLNENRILEEVLEMKEKEIRKLKDEQQIHRKHYEKNLAQMRSVSTERNRLSTSRNVPSKDSDSNRKIRQLEQLLELKHYDLALQRKKWMTEADRDKRQLIQENADLHQRVQDMQSEFDFQRIQLNKEIQSLGQQVDELVKISRQKQEVIFLIQSLVKDLENGNTSRVHELRHNVQELKRNIQSRMKEQSISRERRNLTNSFEQESNFVIKNSGKEYQIRTNMSNEGESPSGKRLSLQNNNEISNGYYSINSMNESKNILNESLKEMDSVQLPVMLNEGQ